METDKETLVDPKSTRGTLRAFWTLASPYWFSEERWVARGLLSVVVALTLGGVYLMVQLNTFYRDFFDAIQKMDEKAFWSLIVKFCGLAASIILVWVSREYFTQTLQNQWRRVMTRRLIEHWLCDKSHYLWHLSGRATDNPDQRIAEDVRDFVNTTLGLSVGLLNQAVTFFSFITILWTLSGSLTVPWGHGRSLSLPGYMAWACLFYAAGGTWVTHRIGRPLIGLNYRRQVVEADFRFALVRLRENSESVALSNGEGAEEQRLKRSFQSVYATVQSIITKQLQLGLFVTGYEQVASIFPLVVAAPRFFGKLIGYGGLMQISNSFGQVKGALSWVVESYGTLAYWRSVVARLEGFEAEVERTKELHARAQSVLQTRPESDCIGLEEVTICLPGSDRPLTQPLTAEFAKGTSVLISGPSGAGKSTLLRAISGIWPFTGGRVYLPQNCEMMVMPQKPYLPTDTLKAVLVYPRQESEVAEDVLLTVLSVCELEHLSGRLAHRENWPLVLSAGEQQRVGWARVFLHKPQWLFLDEASSALDEEMQNRLYRALRERLPKTTLISVAHRQAPQEHHDAVWHFARRAPSLEAPRALTTSDRVNRAPPTT